MTNYTVKAGDTLWAIKISVAELKKANNKSNDTIVPDEVLVIPSEDSEAVPFTASPEPEHSKPKPPKDEIVEGAPLLPSRDGGFLLPVGRYTRQQLDDTCLLARLVYSEAGGEPYEGQVAVAAVALNRIKHCDFPNTLYDVVYQPLTV